MNRRAEQEFGGSNVMDYIVYFIFAGVFILGAVAYIYLQLNGAGVWSDVYAKELALIFDGAKAGDRYVLNVHKATSIALKNEIPFEEIFFFDAVDGKVCVKLSKGTRSCYAYYSNIVAEEKAIQLARPENMLVLKMGEKKGGGA